MPTHDERPLFLREFATFTQRQQDRFLKAVGHLLADVRARQPFRPSLRVKGVQGHRGIFEMTWAGDGRATFEYGPERIAGQTHIIWQRIGVKEGREIPFGLGGGQDVRPRHPSFS
jgi:hypothetical protein